MEPVAIFESLKGKFGDAVAELQSEAVWPPFVVVSAASLPEIARFLRDDPAMKFDSLMCLSGVDCKDRFAVAYRLHSLTLGHRIGLKVFLPRENTTLPSVDAVWPAANFMEREAFDLFGFVFTGSKDLRRI
ncbi:MAG: NADH-quinone oxidoreductase subunit C, partial [Deltaproteobacteria bacterium]|nr:NADH-quinone oxidoreductase subunit C [Deltaproteobacteria bacterium]